MAAQKSSTFASLFRKNDEKRTNVKLLNFTVMSQNNTLSAKAQNIVDNFINKNWIKSSISRTDVMKHVIVTLYAQMPNAKSELVAPFKDCIFDLHNHFSQEEIDTLMAECSQVIMYCLKFADKMYDYSVDFDDYANTLVQEVVWEDEPLNIYKTPESLIELCEKLSGKHGVGDNIYLPYADFSDFALYYPDANYHIECEDHAYDDEEEDILNNYVNSYAQILMDSQGIKAETVYCDCDLDDCLGYLLTHPNYVFAFNPTLNQTINNNFCMWNDTQKVTAADLASKIAASSALVKSGSCLDFIFPSDYLRDKSLWHILKHLMAAKNMTFSATFIKLPSMPFGGTYVSTFLLHIEKDKGNDGMMRFIDVSGDEFRVKDAYTEEAKKLSLENDKAIWEEIEKLSKEGKDDFSFDTLKVKRVTISHTNPKYYKLECLNVERIIEVYNQEECDAKYEERMHYSQFFDKNDHVAHQYLIDKNLPELSEGEKYTPLREIVDIEPTSNVDKGSEIQVLDNKSLCSKYMDCDIDATHLSTKKLEVSTEYFSAPTYHSVNTNCFIAGIVSGSLKIGKLNNVESPIAFKEGIVTFKLKSKDVSEDYLLRELVKEYCSMQARMLADHRFGWKNENDIIAPEYFLDIKIAVPSLEEQARLVKEDAQAYLKEADRKLLQSADEFKRDVHMKKHAIGQTLFNLSNWWDLLQKARKDGNGIVDDSKEIGKIHKRSVSDIYANIQMAMEKLQMQVDRFWRADGLQAQSISLITFIKKYIQEHQSPMFVYDTALSNNVPNVTFSPEALTMVFDNIINNACSHGFENKASESNTVKFEVGISDDIPFITISNNGKPLHDKLTSEDVFTYARSSKTGQSHYGIGGYEVRNLMREFQGDAEFCSMPESDFPVGYKLTFKNINHAEH